MKKKSKTYLKSILSLIIGLSIIGLPQHYVLAQENVADTDNGLELSKNATLNADGSYTISLEAYTTGTVTTIQKSKPTDIVLVLDQSGSMKDGIEMSINYYEVYANGWATDYPSPNLTHYFKKDPSVEVYTAVTRANSLGSIDTPMGENNLYAWKEVGTDNYYVPLKADGTSPNSGYQAVQMYRMDKKAIGTSKLNSLKNAANLFIDNVVNDGGDHRVAVVGFSEGGDKPENFPQQYYENTELFIGAQQYTYGSSEIQEKYASAFQSTKTSAGEANLKESIANLSFYGVTRSDLGMEMANQVLNSDPLAQEEGRNKVVIMFTDGEPNGGGKSSEDPNDGELQPVVANKTIQQANILKNAGAKVYTVGVIDNLDPLKDPTLASTNNLNRYMQYTSNNFPNATSLTNAGSGGDYLAGNFLAATDEESLKQIFSKINEDISSSKLELDDTTILKDIMSDYFTTPQQIDVKTYTSNCTGVDAEGNYLWGEKVEDSRIEAKVIPEKNTIDVDGFNYKENFVAINETTQQPRGAKLIVEFTTRIKDGFIGGSGVPTNNVQSGIYVAGELFEAFPQPVTDIQVKYELPKVNDLGVYLGSNVENIDSLFDSDLNQPGIQYTQNENIFTLDGITNAFVDIVYTITQGTNVIGEYRINAGSTVGTWITVLDTGELTSDVDIQIDAKAIATTNPNNQATASASGKIFVFIPNIRVLDKVIFLGESVNLDELMVTEISWINAQAGGITPSGNEPKLTYQYETDSIIEDKTNFKPIAETTVKIQVWNGTRNITNYSILSGPIHIQVVSGEMTITKTIDENYTTNEAINANQTFVYRIDVRDFIDGPIRETFYQTIDFSVIGNKTSKKVTLTGLSKGYYSVTEESNWSWKYEENIASRSDNYSGNGVEAGVTENQNIFIGDRLNGGNSFFYGSANGTFINGADHSYPAAVNINNSIKDTNILGDAANAKNKFVGNSQ